MSEEAKNLCELPSLCLNKIFGYLDSASVVKTLRVNKFLHKAIEAERGRLQKSTVDLFVSTSNYGVNDSIIIEIFHISVIDGQRTTKRFKMMVYPPDTPESEINDDQPIRIILGEKQRLVSLNPERAACRVIEFITSRANLKDFVTYQFNEAAVQDVADVFELTRPTVGSLSFDSSKRDLSPAGLNRFVNSLRGTPGIALRLYKESISADLFRLRTVRSAPTLDVQPIHNQKHHLALTDADFLALSAQQAKLKLTVDITSNYIRTILLEFLNYKDRMDAHGIGYEIRCKTDDFKRETVFDGVRVRQSWGTGFDDRDSQIYDVKRADRMQLTIAVSHRGYKMHVRRLLDQ